MSNVVEIPSREDIYDQASLWIARLDRELSQAETKDLRAWLSESQVHKEVLFEMASLWDKMDSLSRLSELFEAPATQKIENAPSSPFSSLRFPLGVAASFIMLCSILVLGVKSLPSDELRGWLSGENTVASVVETIYETGLGEHSQVTLPDGSELVLNTDSLIRVQYSDNHRLLLLERGEVHIDVAHDKTRPLSVYAKDRVVQAVGTAFNVEIYNDKEVELIVTDGKVLVARQPTFQEELKAAQPKSLPRSSLAVSKGEKIVLGSIKEKVDRVEEADIAADLSWRQGNLIFRGESLQQAVEEISRYTAVEFELLDDSIKHIRIAGLFKAGDVSGLLSALDQNFNIAYEKIGNEKVLLRAK